MRNIFPFSTAVLKAFGKVFTSFTYLDFGFFVLQEIKDGSI